MRVLAKMDVEECECVCLISFPTLACHVDGWPPPHLAPPSQAGGLQLGGGGGVRLWWGEEGLASSQRRRFTGAGMNAALVSHQRTLLQRRARNGKGGLGGPGQGQGLV